MFQFSVVTVTRFIDFGLFIISIILPRIVILGIILGVLRNWIWNNQGFFFSFFCTYIQNHGFMLKMVQKFNLFGDFCEHFLH